MPVFKKDFRFKNKREFLKPEYFRIWRKRHEHLLNTMFPVDKARWGSKLSLHRIIGEDIKMISGYMRGKKKLSFIDFRWDTPKGQVMNSKPYSLD
jgi:hypothetical protein